MNPITARDVALLRDTWQYRYLTSHQVARLHFGSQKVAQRRLRKLTGAGLLQRFCPAEAKRAGFQTWWYCLSRPGARLISSNERLPLNAVLPPTRHPRTLGFLAHHALLTDFRVWLYEACANMPGFTYRFIPSYEEATIDGRRERRAAISLGTDRVLFPDGALVLTKADRHALFFVEIDRGTEPLTGKHPNAIERKLTSYRAAYDASAEEQFAHRVQATVQGFRLLCIVPDETRQARFIDLAERLDLAPLVWVTTAQHTQAPGKLDTTMWTVTPAGDRHALTE